MIEKEKQLDEVEKLEAEVMEGIEETVVEEETWFILVLFFWFYSKKKEERFNEEGTKK